MTAPNILQGSRIVTFMWLLLSLGSCSVIQNNYMTQTTIMSFEEYIATETQRECHEFIRTLRLGHTKPKLPEVDIAKLESEDIIILLFDYAEGLNTYIDNEARYLREDTLRHAERCQPE